MFRRISTFLIAGLLTATVAAGSVSAAVRAGKPARMKATAARQMPLQRFSKALSLTPEQTQQVSVIIERLRTDAKALAASGKTPQEKRTAMLQFRASAKNNIYALLTSDQRTKADQGRLVEKLLTPKMQVGMMQVLARLNLSPDQKTKVQGIVKDAETRAKAVRADTSLTPQARKAKMMDIRKGTIDSISAILTPDQRTKFMQWVNGKRGGRMR